MKLRVRWLCLVLVSALVVGAAGVNASAQSAPQAEPLRLPKPQGEPEATPIMSILTAIVVGGIVIVATLLPSKRGHQD